MKEKTYHHGDGLRSVLIDSSTSNWLEDLTMWLWIFETPEGEVIMLIFKITDYLEEEKNCLTMGHY